MKFWSTWAQALLVQHAASITLKIKPDGGNASSPLLYGMMFEDINHSGDGGIHGQMLRNNGFQGDNPGLTAWDSVGPADISQDTSSPVSGAIRSSILIKPQQGATAPVGARNAGYFGMKIDPGTYASYFFVKGNFEGNVTVAIVNTPTATVFGSTQVYVKSTADKFAYYQTSINSEQPPDSDNAWHFFFDPSLAPQGLNLGLPQLYPKTFKERFNGLQPQIAQAMDDIGGSFLRFPGGNNLEGSSFEDRWIWNNTIGKLEDRPGRQGDWSYPNTDALGLVEYVLWCQDMNLTPILALWSGLTLGGGAIEPADIGPYVQDALNELEYLMGDASTEWGALRVSHGYPDPFLIEYVEIGNEEFLNNGPATYQGRFDAFYTAIKAVYPNMNIISASGADNGFGPQVDKGTFLDLHYYLSPSEFAAAFDQFDNYDRDYPIFVGEYGSTHADDGSTLYFTNMRSSAAEAVYMVGMERNSDVVRMACFAPVLERYEDAQWHPNLFGFDAAHGVTRSTSYFVQRMFASNRGTSVLPVDSDAGFGPVYWVASAGNGKTFVKLVNFGDTEQTATLDFAASVATATLTQLSGPPEASNTPGAEAVAPATRDLTANEATVAVTLPAWSVSVVAVSLAG